MIKIARGEKPLSQEPRVWVSSLDALLRVLTEKNMLLLEIIRNSQPQSLTELAQKADRALPNVTRTLRSLERLGIVAIEVKEDGKKVPIVLWQGDKVELDFEAVRSRAA
jgi:predicted transcriptional regulator